VTISGQLTPDQVRTYESEIQRPAYFSLITDVLADCAKDPYDCSAGPASLVGCELTVDLVHPLITLDTTTGRVSGSFTVGGEGRVSRTGLAVTHRRRLRDDMTWRSAATPAASRGSE
jgi:hypothetical protein